MENQQEFQERAITIKRPEHHFAFLVAPDGAMLGLDDHGDFALYNDADDRVIWDRATGGMKHVATGKDVPAIINEDTCTLQVGSDEVIFTISHGPEKLPSLYLEHLKREGWVCVTCILTPAVLEGLERVAGTDRYEHLEMSNDIPKLCQDVAVGKAVTEPVSLWLIRQYMQTRELHLGHPPGFRVLDPDDGVSRVGGWHSDIPYSSSSGSNSADRKGPVKAVQRNVCVTDFTKIRGATVFKLGSHLADTSPPPEWNPARHDGPPDARPYSGPEADVLEAPGGSIILYDARTWHRAGFNRSEHKRAAMLQSFQTVDVIPKRDTRHVCGRLNESSVYQDLNNREQREITDLLLNQPPIS